MRPAQPTADSFGFSTLSSGSVGWIMPMRRVVDSAESTIAR